MFLAVVSLWIIHRMRTVSSLECLYDSRLLRPGLEFCPVLSSVLRGVNDVCECAMVSYPELNAAVVVDLSLHTGLRGNLK